MRAKLITILSIFLCFQIALSHKQNVHQYIVREAYTLLKNNVGDIPVMASHISTDEGGGGGTWVSGLMTAGA